MASSTTFINDAFKAKIAEYLATKTGQTAALLFPLIEIPKTVSHGDFSVPVPRLRAKGNPVELAAELAKDFLPNELIASSNSIGTFLNFSVNKTALLTATLKAALTAGSNWGNNMSGRGAGPVLIEYSSPNIAKPFHIGHFRTTMIGNFVKNLYKANGYETVSINYLGDWGKQFGLLAVGFGLFGNEEALATDPINHLLDVYVKINNAAKENPDIHEQAKNYFLQMERGNEEYLVLWRRFCQMSKEKYKEIYTRLGIHFDVYSGESLYEGKMKASIDKLESMNLLTDSKGAKIVDLSAYKLEKPLVVKSDGATLYLTRDIAAAEDRYNQYKFHKSIYVIASEQDLHMKQLYKILELMGFPWAGSCLHINYGMVLGLSTRDGNTVFLEEVLNNARDKMHAEMQKNATKYAQISDPLAVSENLAISAMVVQDMSARRIKDYSFNYDRMTSFEGDTGPYLQYAHSRLCSIERKAAEQGIVISPDSLNAYIPFLDVPSAHAIVPLIARWPEIVADTLRSHEPCNIVNHLFSLSHAISSAMEDLWVLGQEKDVASARLALYAAARMTLGAGLRILGLTPLERM